MKICTQCLTRYAWTPSGLCERCLAINMGRRCEFIEFTVKAPLEVREELTETAYDHSYGDLVGASE